MVAPRTRRHATVLALLGTAAFLTGAALGTLQTPPPTPTLAMAEVRHVDPVAEPVAREVDDSGTFTLEELAAGEVTAERFNAFWADEVARIESAPCPAAPAPGATVVVVSVGATPPAHLGPDHVDWAPALETARAAAAEACG